MHLWAPRVLLVEDDRLFRESVAASLGEAGYQIDQAANGHEAVTHVTRQHYDLVLLDYDLPGLMGDATLERMLALRPGLVCLVLSGKDDLHQALLMGRRGAYGWIDKYTSTDHLLKWVAEGLRLRPEGLDLSRLVMSHYPQPIAAAFSRWERIQDTEYDTSERLDLLRELFESWVGYLAISFLCVYLERGLLQQDLNTRLLPSARDAGVIDWADVLKTLSPYFVETPSAVWLHDLARILLRPLAGAQAIARCATWLGEIGYRDVALRAPSRAAADESSPPLSDDTPSEALSPPDTSAPLGLVIALANYSPLWEHARRMAPSEQKTAVQHIEPALIELTAALRAVADAELVHVREVSVIREDEHAHNLSALSGLSIQNRTLRSTDLLERGLLYLLSRPTQQRLGCLHPFMVLDACPSGALMPQGVYWLTRTDRACLMYLSSGCGQVRVRDQRELVEALDHVLYSLNPTDRRFEHLLTLVTVCIYDLSGFTRLTHTHGAPFAREMVRRMVSVVRECVTHHGGQVGSVVGDEVVAFFPDPTAAVESAVDAHRRLAEHNRRNLDQPLHIHVGIDHGPGLIHGRQVWGDVVNRAKRCQTLAEADQIVISSSVRQQLPDPCPWPLESFSETLKGLGGVAVFRVQWATAPTA